MNGWSDNDRRLMQEALVEAGSAAMAGEVPVGAIVATGSTILGRGRNRPIADHDPSAHAEIVALRRAAAASANYRLPGATLYVTLEPCVMCVGAMLHARVSRLVFGAYDPKAGAAGSVLDLCADRRMNHRIEVNGGLMEGEAVELLRHFFESRRL